MTTIDRRRRGRAIRKARRIYEPDSAGVAFATLSGEFESFKRALAGALRSLDRLDVALSHRPQILHNGRKPR